jgi:hypothetical protein
VQTAVAYLRGGIKQIAHLVPREDRRKFLRESNEARILLDMLRQIRAQLPVDPRMALKRRLNDAIRSEKYEEAAALRDQLEFLQRNPQKPGAIGENPAQTPRPAKARSRKSKRSE